MLEVEPYATDDLGGRDTMRSRLVAVGLAVVTAGALTFAPYAARAADEPTVRVEYDPPHLSVAAGAVGLGELLRAIGAKVGFTVAEGRAPSPPVTVSITSDSVDDVLRQLLRTENHAILYRQGAGATVIVDRIVLLGAPAEGASVLDTGPRPSHEAPAVASSAPGSEAAPQTAAARAAPMSSRAGESATTDEQPVTVGDMLRSHALAGLPPQPAAVAEPAAPSVPPSLEESLAITTRRAQQGLTSLVEGLERATRSLQQPAPAPAAGR
jgi:hypothetical protein